MPFTDQPLRILVADDNAINRRVAELMLKHAGFTVDMASDGSEAVEAHTSRPYDVILMDSQMPVMDGFEATRRIRQMDQPQPVIIAITANALSGERERCLSLGMDDYVSKPFTAEQLRTVVRKGVERAMQQLQTCY
jgi:two-component system, sensor histidine kinase and response regulator